MNLLPSVPILTAAETAAFEADCFRGEEERQWRAMEAAGAAIAAAVAADFQEVGLFPLRAQVLVLVGKGHNGGDALIAAEALLQTHPAARADILFLFGERALRPLAAKAWQRLQSAPGGRVAVIAARALETPRAEGWDIALDGVFGFQFRPPLPAAVAQTLRRVNGKKIRLRAAVDLPSGLDAADAFRADFTYATGSVKREALEAANAGRLRYLDLGLFREHPDFPGTDRVLTRDVLEPLRALRPARVDKRTFGHLAIVGGSRSYPGAVLMNALAALHSGVGLVTVFVPETLAASFASRAPEAMWVGCPETPRGTLARAGLGTILKKLERVTALALGSGLDRDEETLTLAGEVVAGSSGPVLLDGDGIQPELVAAAKGRLLVLTPHAGEFARLAGGDADLREFCASRGCTVVLKGPVTRICSGGPGSEGPGSRVVYHSLWGGPILARGGSGDLLAGLTAGQLALLSAENDSSAPLTAAARGVTWHGLASDALARHCGQTSVGVSAMVPLLSSVLREES